MRVSIVGAYGYTGHLICKELDSAGISFSIFGRNKEKLDSLKEEFNSVSTALDLDMRNSEDVQKLIEISDVIVNCAGPFTEEAQLLVDSVAENGKTYLDICGEVGFVRDSWTRNHSKAQKSKALIIHGCAFESFVADLMVQSLIGGVSGVQSIRSFYWFNQKKISPGTRMTMKLSKYRELLKIDNGDWAIGDTVKDQVQVHWSNSDASFIAVPYPLPEVAYGKWNYNAKSVGSYLLLDKNQTMFVGIGNKSNESTVDILDKIRLFKREGPTREELAAQRSVLTIEIIDKNDNALCMMANSINMYETSAVAILLVIQKILKNPDTYSGVISPARLFEGEENETLGVLKVEIDSEQQLIVSDV